MDVVVTSPNGAPVDASTNAAPSVAQPAAGPERPLVLAELRDQPLSVDECLAAVALPQAGGTAVFVGTVRDHDAGRHVVELEYVAHPLAAQELLAVAREVAGLPATALFGAVGAGPASGDGGDVASGGGSAGGGSAGGHGGAPAAHQHGQGTGRVLAVAVLHRTGVLKIGDIAVVAAASAAHRAEAFAACRRLIDDTKSRVPIWKRQLFGDGTAEWVGACSTGHLG